MGTIAQRPRRADALRNRHAVVQAAEQVFAEKGLEASIPEIAARAGVGKATVYRSFPSKEHLVAAVACVRLSWVTEQAVEALAQRDPVKAFEQLIVAVAERQCRDRSVAGAMAARIRLPEVDTARAEAHAAIDALMARGRATGGLRTGVDSRDVHVLLSGVARVLRDRDERDPAAWRRYGALVVDALRTPSR